MRAIVTVKLPRNPKHTPRNKQTGKCPLFRPPYQRFELQGKFTCTDTTGSHHSYIEYGSSVNDIWNTAKRKYGHVTRIEVVVSQ